MSKTALLIFVCLTPVAYATTGWDAQKALVTIEIVATEPAVDLDFLNDCEYLFYGYCLGSGGDCPKFPKIESEEYDHEK